ncbi:hypothetical protein K0U00_44715, partial [Paenibacillus sepulcri]|nr:hypothetical protein [Paenibacillus sepulcri]
MKTVWAWLGHHKTVQLLQLAGILRSLCQGIAVVNLSLYLKELGWTGGAIGALFAGTGLVRAVLTSFAGELNALLGPKRFMLLFEIMTAVSALILTVTSSSIALSAAVAAAGFGWGHT